MRGLDALEGGLHVGFAVRGRAEGVADSTKAAISKADSTAEIDSCLLTSKLLAGNMVLRLRYCNAAFVLKCR